jgi:hypothetical protein
MFLFLCGWSGALRAMQARVQDGQALIDLEVEGVKNVFSAIEKAGTVKKVRLVKTSTFPL